MTIELQALQRLAVYREPSGSFATDHSATPNDFQDVPFRSGSLSWTSGRQFLQKNTAQQLIDGHDGPVQGHKRPTISFEVIAYPTGTPAGDGVASITSANSALFALLEGILGGETSGNEGSTIQTVNTVSSVDVDSGDGSEWAKNYGIGLQDSTGRLEIHEVFSVSTDTIETKIDADITAAAAACFGTTSFHLAESDKSFQFILEGAEQSDRWLLQGMQVTSIAFNAPTDDFPTFTFTFEGVNYQALSGAAITAATYENYNPVHRTGPLLAATAEDSAGSTTTNVCNPSRSLSLNINFGPVVCPGSTYGIDRWKRRRSAPVATMEFTTYFEDATWYTAADNGDSKYLSQQFGISAADGGFAIVLPNAQVIDVNRGDENDLAAQTVTVEAKQDFDSGDLGASPFRLHFV